MSTANLGPKVFSFATKAHWINRASKEWKSHYLRLEETVCIDQKGRICTSGLHFRVAEEDNAYPIDVHLFRADFVAEYESRIARMEAL